MKLSSRQYAESLYESLQGKDPGEIGVCIGNFLALVRKNGKTKDLERIMANFEDIFNEKEGILPVEIETYREISEEEKKEIENFLKEKYGQKKIIINQKVNQEIIGGIILKAGDDLWDFSLARKIRRIKAQIKK